MRRICRTSTCLWTGLVLISVAACSRAEGSSPDNRAVWNASDVTRPDDPAPATDRPRGASRIDGRVLDASGAPLRRARVALLTTGGRELIATHTDRDGAYELPGLPAGTYRL